MCMFRVQLVQHVSLVMTNFTSWLHNTGYIYNDASVGELQVLTVYCKLFE